MRRSFSWERITAWKRDIVPRYGYELKFITVSGLNRKKLWKNVQTVRDLKKGTNEARAVIREFQPDLVIGTGGYVCGPMVRTAASWGFGLISMSRTLSRV